MKLPPPLPGSPGGPGSSRADGDGATPGKPSTIQQYLRFWKFQEEYESRKRARAILDSIVNPPAPESPASATEPSALRGYLVGTYGRGPLPRDLAPIFPSFPTHAEAEPAPAPTRRRKSGRVARLEAEVRRQKAQNARLVEELRVQARAIVALERKAVTS